MIDRCYEYRHVVGFEETSVVGNVYYVNHLRWQGRCREMFLSDHAPGVLNELKGGLSLATLRCSCEYIMELRAFDVIAVRMRLEALVQHRLTLAFEYWRLAGSKEELVARGEQEIACLIREGDRLTPTPVPQDLRTALRAFSDIAL